MKRKSKGPVRRVRVRAVVAYPALSVALVVSVALALTSFGSSQVMALGAAAIPLATTAPTPTTTDSPTTTTAPTPTETTSPSTIPTPSPSSGTAPVAAPGDHHVLARIEGPELQPSYLPIDEPAPNATPFQTFRVRFRLQNAGPDPFKVTPLLEYRAEGGGAYAVVPEQPKVGVPFHVDREWVPSLGLAGGTMEGRLGEDIAVSDFRMGTGSGFAVNGHHSMGANPDQPITLPSDSYTEQEFTVTLSIDAKYLSGYQLRITDRRTALTGTDVATIRLGAAPAVLLSPGQRQGVAVVGPTPATSTAGAAYPLVVMSSVSAVSAVYRPNTLSYPLTASIPSAAPAVTGAIHGPYTITTSACDFCHRGHAAQAPKLLVKGSQSSLCFTCHGTAPGAVTNVQAEYGGSLPDNVSTTTIRDYFSHDAEAGSNHSQSGLDEFGSVANRHSSCADCHNSHKATKDAVDGINPDSIQTVTGWSASGRLAGVSGVSVFNSETPGAAPTYTFMTGVSDAATDDFPVPNAATGTSAAPITREYQLCFKCHSSFTTLLPKIAGKPSTDELDKAAEFNPVNASFHPIEAAGTNQTTKMTANLAATSPYKLWNFEIGSTVRCLNCHTSGSRSGGAPDLPPVGTDPLLPLPGSSLAPHTSSNRGILLRPYRDRVLKSATDAYSAGDFALCYVCHGEEPFKNSTRPASSDATNFSLHGKHLNLLTENGQGSTDIDEAGAGQGNAICAECHFRIHSTTFKNETPTQVVDGSRLVNFAPNVQVAEPSVGATAILSWTPGLTAGSGSCTLTCHGHPHATAPYSP